MLSNSNNSTELFPRIFSACSTAPPPFRHPLLWHVIIFAFIGLLPNAAFRTENCRPRSFSFCLLLLHSSFPFSYLSVVLFLPFETFTTDYSLLLIFRYDGRPGPPSYRSLFSSDFFLLFLLSFLSTLFDLPLFPSPSAPQ